MTRAASPSPGGQLAQSGRLRTPFTILILSLTGLIVLMFCLWIYTEGNALVHQAGGQWAPYAWAAIWCPLAALGLCACVIPGLVLCVRPALFALILDGSGPAAVRNWPRLRGLALLWGGLGVIAVAVPPLAQVGQVARGLVPEVNGTAAAVTLAVAFMPSYALMLVALLLRPARHQPPAAEDGPSLRRD